MFVHTEIYFLRFAINENLYLLLYIYNISACVRVYVTQDRIKHCRRNILQSQQFFTIGKYFFLQLLLELSLLYDSNYDISRLSCISSKYLLI